MSQLTMFKMMLPALQRAMKKSLGFNPHSIIFYMDNDGTENLNCHAESSSGEKTEKRVNPEMQFAQVILSGRNTIEGAWDRATLVIDFAEKTMGSQVFTKDPEGKFILRDSATY